MKVLITAGQVYGKLDDNKLVGNRVRGIWACKLAAYLSAQDHHVTLLVPDTMSWPQVIHMIGETAGMGAISRNGSGGFPGEPCIEVVWHKGFDEYRAKCKKLAATHDAAVMAAAVVNWIPAEPISGKMATAGYKVGDRIDIPFYLAPRVIEEMKAENPKLTLIGCKMLIDSTEEELIEAAYGVLLKSRCNVVIANDMGRGLRRKLLVYKDRSVHEYNDDFEGFFAALTAVIEDEHFRTVYDTRKGMLYEADCWNARSTFDRLVTRHHDRFTPVEGGRVFGSLAVPTGISGGRVGWLVSPREKGEAFTSRDATLVTEWDPTRRTVTVPEGWNKPTLNAVLLIRYAQQFLNLVTPVLHFHEQMPGLPTLPYAPPGTVRDNLRELPEECSMGFNIEGHGCVLPA
jgi:hypothetical protein